MMREPFDEFDQFDQLDTEKKWKLPVKKRWIFLGLLLMVLISVGLVLFTILPRKDKINTKDIPDSYVIENTDNYYAYQSGSDCAGYASAYVLRHFGIEADGAQLYKEMPTFFGRVALHNIVHEFDDYGFKAKAYYGSIETLKMELLKGVPVVALIKIKLGSEEGLHYVAVVGYDQDYIYMADSTRPKTNIYDCTMYNRKLKYDEFEDLWKTKVYPMHNCYIVVDKKEE
jgi:hypothetical protein